VIGLALPVEASPGAQTMFPTPTVFPVDEVVYTLETVGGVQETLTFEYAPDGAIDPGTATATSQYPNGMVFTLAPGSSNGEIEDVILFLRNVDGSWTRVAAEYDAEREVWAAHPVALSAEQPAWKRFEFYWRVRDGTGAMIDTPPFEAEYSDPTREWFRMETPYSVVYWFGFSEDDPDFFAREMSTAIAATTLRLVEGLGRTLNYTPISVLYPSREAMSEIVGGDVNDPFLGSHTTWSFRMIVQYFEEDETVVEGAEWMSHWLTHELTHLYLIDAYGGRGTLWWNEGQAE